MMHRRRERIELHRAFAFDDGVLYASEGRQTVAVPQVRVGAVRIQLDGALERLFGIRPVPFEYLQHRGPCRMRFRETSSSSRARVTAAFTFAEPSCRGRNPKFVINPYALASAALRVRMAAVMTNRLFVVLGASWKVVLLQRHSAAKVGLLCRRADGAMSGQKVLFRGVSFTWISCAIDSATSFWSASMSPRARFRSSSPRGGDRWRRRSIEP